MQITLENIKTVFPFNEILIFHKALNYAVPLDSIEEIPIFQNAKISHFASIDDKIYIYCI